MDLQETQFVFPCARTFSIEIELKELKEIVHTALNLSMNLVLFKDKLDRV